MLLKVHQSTFFYGFNYFLFLLIDNCNIRIINNVCLVLAITPLIDYHYSCLLTLRLSINIKHLSLFPFIIDINGFHPSSFMICIYDAVYQFNGGARRHYLKCHYPLIKITVKYKKQYQIFLSDSKNENKPDITEVFSDKIISFTNQP